MDVPAEPADLKEVGAVPPLVTEINLSLDDRFLYAPCWDTGELRQCDVSDPFDPRHTTSVHLSLKGGGMLRTEGVSLSVLKCLQSSFQPQILKSLEIQPVALWSVFLTDDADQGVVARGAAHHRTYLAHVGHLGADLTRRAAAGAGCQGRGDLEGEDLC
jgi:hypothetical protein